MTHRRLTEIERHGDHLGLSCPYVVDVVQEAPGTDNRNTMPWSRLFLMDPRGPAADDRVTDLAARRPHPLMPGRTLFLPPDRLYGFRFAPGMRMIAYHFRLEWAPGCDVFSGADRCLEIADAAPLIGAAYAALETGEGLAAATILRGILLALAGRCLSEPRVPSPRIRTALELIERGCRADLRVPELAHAAGLGREGFSRIFRREVGLSPQEHLHRRLVQRAAGLLLDGKKVKETAEALGFSTEFAFSRFFRARTGVPPRNFRLLPD